MRVALVNYEYPGVTDNCGGGGQVTQSLETGLRDRGHDVRVVTDPADGHYATFSLRRYSAIADAVRWADVVNGHFSIPSSIALPRLCARHDTPLVVTVMGADVFDPTRFQHLRPLTHPVNRYILHHADAVVVPSADMEWRVREHFGLDADVIHYGIDPTVWASADRPEPEPEPADEPVAIADGGGSGGD